MDTNRIETEVIIVDVVDDAKWKYSIEAEIPAFDGDKNYRFIAWNKKQGPPPQIGAIGFGTMEGYSRSKFYVDRGELEPGAYDGTEQQYMVTWNMVAFVEGATVGATGDDKTAVRGSQTAPKTKPTTYLAAPTPEERLKKDLAKFRREQLMISFRHASEITMQMMERGVYTMEGFIEERSKFKKVLRLEVLEVLEDELSEVRLDNAAPVESPLVKQAQAMGAVVVDVQDDEISKIKNRPDLDAFVASKEWARDKISGVIQDAGFASSAQYLQDKSNSVQGLARLLNEKLGSW